MATGVKDVFNSPDRPTRPCLRKPVEPRLRRRPASRRIADVTSAADTEPSFLAGAARLGKVVISAPWPR